jgi:5'-3' exonuclease
MNFYKTKLKKLILYLIYKVHLYIIVVIIMGVPHFFKWLAKKYQSCFIKNNLDLGIFVLLLDNNCLIHPQTSMILEKYHNWEDLDFLENKMCKQIVTYMKDVYDRTNAKYLYIAIDGPVPMAKVHQQRLRRFKGIVEKQITNQIKMDHGKKIANYWSNASITPGTKFMNKINSNIKDEILKQKFSNAICVFSTSDVAGEGEHKIFGYLKKNAKLFHNKIKVIYGLDADLIFLSLASGMPNIFLMRENTELGYLGDQEHYFNYVDIDVVRDCIVKEMCWNNELNANDNKKIYDEFDLEIKQKYINDFIFITFLIGNDFLPTVECLEVSQGGEDKIINVWKSCYKKLNQFLINNNEINFIFFGMFINILSLNENNYYIYDLPEVFTRNYKMNPRLSDPYEIDMFEYLHMKRHRIHNPKRIGEGHTKYWKKFYYEQYFDCSIRNACKQYVDGLYWIINYYFNNEPISWSWFYPYLRSPLLNDLNVYLQTSKNIFKFELSKPLEPYIQLLCVLHPYNSNLLLKELQFFVNDEKSEIKDLFPERFHEDRINKTLAYKCLPIIPVLDIKRILKAVSKIKFNPPKKILAMRFNPNDKKHLVV